MAKRKNRKRFYAVAKGHIPGIYKTSAELIQNITKFPNYIAKSFKTETEAEEFITKISNYIKQNQKAIKSLYELEPEICDNDDETIVKQSPISYAYIDGSFNPNTNYYGCGGFLIHNKKKYIIKKKDNNPTLLALKNVAGEILGSHEIIQKAVDLNIKEIIIFYDFSGIEMFATGIWSRKNDWSDDYYKFFQNVKDHINIHFIKVNAHKGVKGNNEADKLAREAVGLKAISDIRRNKRKLKKERKNKKKYILKKEV